MIWGASIWLNKFLVNCIDDIIWILITIICIDTIAIIYSLCKFVVQRIKFKTRLKAFVKKSYVLTIVLSIIVSCIGIALFYMPQAVLPKQLSFNEISITKTSLIAGMKTIHDKESIKEFSNILSGYTCRRSLDIGQLSINTDEVRYIDLVASHDGKINPMRLIVKKDGIIRYTEGGTDFYYIVKDSKHQLSKKIFAYSNKVFRRTK